MLHSVNAHKYRNDKNENDADISSLINKLTSIEDTKTSSIIGTLSHLPADIFWEILRTAVKVDDKLPKTVSEIHEIDFWPSWRLNGDRVEPDTFVRFKEFDLILEMKVNDSNPQKTKQWKRELGAYKEKYHEQRKVYLIAVSGMIGEQCTDVFQCSWTSLLDATLSVLEREESKNRYSHIVRILNDAVMAFRIHHEHSYRYFSSIDYNPESYHINEYNNIFNQL